MIFVNTPCNLASLRTIWKMCSFLWLRKTTWIESRGQNYENAGNRTSERKANRRNPRVAGCWHLGAAYAFVNFIVRKDTLLNLPLAPMDVLLTQLYGMIMVMNLFGIVVAAA